MSDEREKIFFPVNEHGWIFLFEILGSKILLRTLKLKKYPKKQPISDECNQHRTFQYEIEGSTRVHSKYYNTSDFVKK